MKHLLNTLFVTSEDIYLSLDGENVVANREHQEIARYPLHTFSKKSSSCGIGRGCLQKATAFSPSRTISCMGVSPISSLSQVNSLNMSKVISDSGFSVYKALPLLFPPWSI